MCMQTLMNYDYQCLGFLHCAHLLLHAIAHGGCMNPMRESALNVDWDVRSLVTLWKWTCRYCALLFSLILYHQRYNHLTRVIWHRLWLPLFQPFGMNDTVGCFLDLDNWEIRWAKNGMCCVLMRSTVVIKFCCSEDFISTTIFSWAVDTVRLSFEAHRQ